MRVSTSSTNMSARATDASSPSRPNDHEQPRRGLALVEPVETQRPGSALAETGGKGGDARRGLALAEMFHVKHHPEVPGPHPETTKAPRQRSGPSVLALASDDGVPVLPFALGLRREAALGHDIVHELALVRRHRGEGR